MEDLNSITVFTKVAEKKSFSLAAKELRISPSAASRHVSELERRLGVMLVVRSTRKLSLTEAGNAFFEQSVKAIGDLKAAIDNVGDLYSKPRGTLRVSAAGGFADAVLTPLIHEFIGEHPELRVELTVNTTPVNLVEAGLDVVIRSGRLLDTSLSFRELVPVKYLICAAPKFFARHGKPERPKDLERYNCLTHAVYSSNEWWFSENGHDVAVRVRGNYEANSSDALRKAAINGLGITRIPDYVARRDVEAGRLETALDGLAISKQVMRAFFPRTKKVPAKISVFLDFLERRIKPAISR